MFRSSNATASPGRPRDRTAIFFVVVELLIFGAILAFAWITWSAWPAVPFADPDTWGYLNPGLGWLGGGAFVQAGGRDWLYPVLVAFFLKTTGSFAGLLFWQKLLSLLAAILMVVTWRSWVTILPFNRWIHFFASLLGAIPIFVQLINQQAIYFQMCIRPEAILPFFVYAQLAVLIGYCKYRWKTPRALPSFLLGAATILLAYACFLLKPSWYLASLLTSAVVFAGCLGRSIPWMTRLLTPIAGLAAAIVALWMPGQFLVRHDAASVTLLPLALFCVHGELVDHLFEDKLATMSPIDPQRAKLQHLDETLKSEMRTSASLPNTYTYLHINPDYLLASHSLNMAIVDCAGSDPDAIKSFCMQSFTQAALHAPGAYAEKVHTQFTHFLLPDSKTFFRDQVDLGGAYRLTADSLAEHRPADLRADEKEMYHRYEEDVRTQVANGKTLEPLPKVSGLSKFLARHTLWLEILFFSALAASLIWKPLHALRAGGASAFALFLTPFGSALGVSLVHALDIYRYRATYGGYFLLALTAMLIFALIVFAEALIHIAGRIYARRS